MKLKAIVVLIAALAAGAGAFAWCALRTGRQSVVREPELRWLQHEFALNDDAALRIAELHRHYMAACEPMCEELRASDAVVSRLIASHKRVTPELTAALNRSNQIVVECQQRMLNHFYAVAREMPPVQGKRYLDLMTPIAAHPEQGWMKMTP